VKDPIQVSLLIVQILGLLALIWYVYETFKLRKAAQRQVEISQGLIEAAMDQVEGLSKPCLTLCGELRDDMDTIVGMHGAVGRTTARADQGHFIVQNIGNGVALNVRYRFNPVGESDGRSRSNTSGYLQNVLAGQRISMAELVTAFNGDYEVSFLYQSIGGRQYLSVVTMNSRVLTGFEFERAQSNSAQWIEKGGQDGRLLALPQTDIVRGRYDLPTKTK
jgi:hypothetical protein